MARRARAYAGNPAPRRAKIAPWAAWQASTKEAVKTAFDAGPVGCLAHCMASGDGLANAHQRQCAPCRKGAAARKISGAHPPSLCAQRARSTRASVGQASHFPRILGLIDQPPSAMTGLIRIHGARQHNLQNLDLDILHRRVHGGHRCEWLGKSSLVFDTLYAEGQRRYAETFQRLRAPVSRPHG